MVNEYNEISYAESMLENGFLTNRRIYELNILSKYFFHTGNTMEDVQKKVLEFCYKNMKDFNENKYSDIICSVLKNAQKTKIIELKEIPVTEKDIEFINSFNEDKKFKEVLFCLLIIKKIRNILGQNPYLNYKYSKFAKMCGIRQTKDIYPILKRLEDSGLVNVCRNSNLKINFEISEENTKTIFAVRDFNSSFSYYRNYMKLGKYKECENCGRIIKVVGNRKTYCSDCAKKIKLKQTAECKKRKKMQPLCEEAI